MVAVATHQIGVFRLHRIFQVEMNFDDALQEPKNHRASFSIQTSRREERRGTFVPSYTSPTTQFMAEITDETAWKVGNRLAYTLMDNAGSTKLHLAQLLFTSICKKKEKIVLCYLYFTLPASPSDRTVRETHNAHSDTLNGNSAESTDNLFCTQGPSIVSRFPPTAVFDRKFETSLVPNSRNDRSEFRSQITPPHFFHRKKTCEETSEKGALLIERESPLHHNPLQQGDCPHNEQVRVRSKGIFAQIEP